MFRKSEGIFVKFTMSYKLIQNLNEKSEIAKKVPESVENQLKKSKISQKTAQNHKILTIQKQMQRPKCKELNAKFN